MEHNPRISRCIVQRCSWNSKFTPHPWETLEILKNTTWEEYCKSTPLQRINTGPLEVPLNVQWSLYDMRCVSYADLKIRAQFYPKPIQPRPGAKTIRTEEEEMVEEESPDIESEASEEEKTDELKNNAILDLLHKITQEHIFSKVTGQEITIDPMHLEDKSIIDERRKYRQQHTKSFEEDCQILSEMDGRTRRETVNVAAMKLTL